MTLPSHAGGGGGGSADAFVVPIQENTTVGDCMDPLTPPRSMETKPPFCSVSIAPGTGVDHHKNPPC